MAECAYARQIQPPAELPERFAGAEFFKLVQDKCSVGCPPIDSLPVETLELFLEIRRALLRTFLFAVTRDSPVRIEHAQRFIRVIYPDDNVAVAREVFDLRRVGRHVRLVPRRKDQRWITGLGRRNSGSSDRMRAHGA